MKGSEVLMGREKTIFCNYFSCKITPSIRVRLHHGENDYINAQFGGLRGNRRFARAPKRSKIHSNYKHLFVVLIVVGCEKKLNRHDKALCVETTINI
jgi:hypothetical protein